jgi:hypothetical protein
MSQGLVEMLVEAMVDLIKSDPPIDVARIANGVNVVVVVVVVVVGVVLALIPLPFVYHPVRLQNITYEASFLQNKQQRKLKLTIKAPKSMNRSIRGFEKLSSHSTLQGGRMYSVFRRSDASRDFKSRNIRLYL